MDGVRLAKLAVFLQLDPVRVIPLILLSAVISLFALSTFNRNSNSHPFTPPDTLLLKSSIREVRCQRCFRLLSSSVLLLFSPVRLFPHRPSVACHFTYLSFPCFPKISTLDSRGKLHTEKSGYLLF